MVDVGVLGEHWAETIVTDNDVEHTRREVLLGLKHVLERHERGERARLDNDSASGKQGGEDLPERQDEGVVPWNERS